MSQETLPEIQVATEALESRIAITEGEVGRMTRNLRKAQIIACAPKGARHYQP